RRRTARAALIDGRAAELRTARDYRRTARAPLVEGRAAEFRPARKRRGVARSALQIGRAQRRRVTDAVRGRRGTTVAQVVEGRVAEGLRSTGHRRRDLSGPLQVVRAQRRASGLAEIRGRLSGTAP